MELVLIPFLLLSGATLIYLGVHGAQPTPWAMHGPHISTSSGERKPLALIADRPVPIAVEANESRDALLTPETLKPVEEMRPAEGNIIDEVGPARTFTQSDALIGQLMMELTTVRDELTSLRVRLDTLAAPAQPDTAVVAHAEPATESPAPPAKRRRTAKSAVAQEVAA